MHSRGLVSVLMPAHNAAATIGRAIESVFAQSYVDWKLIIVDDASSDATVDLIEHKRRGREESVVLIKSDRNGGPAKARNLGLAVCTGEWIALLDADDAWREDRLELLFLNTPHCSADAICDNLLGFDDTLSRTTEPLFKRLPATLSILEALEPYYGGTYNLGYLKPIFRLSFIERHELRYDEELRTGEDLLYLLNILVRNGKVVCIDQPTYVYTLPIRKAGWRVSQSTQTPSGDLDLSMSLGTFLDVQMSRLTSDEQRAIRERIALLIEMAPISEFRSAQLRGDWMRALRLISTKAAVRRWIVSRALRATALLQREAP